MAKHISLSAVDKDLTPTAIAKWKSWRFSIPLPPSRNRRPNSPYPLRKRGEGERKRERREASLPSSPPPLPSFPSSKLSPRTSLHSLLLQAYRYSPRGGGARGTKLNILGRPSPLVPVARFCSPPLPPPPPAKREFLLTGGIALLCLLPLPLRQNGRKRGNMGKRESGKEMPVRGV